MKYLFILGSNPSLSVAEIISRLNLPETAVKKTAADFMVAEYERGLKPEEMMATLGGTIKIGKVLDTAATPENLSQYLADKRITRPIFGISRYGSLSGPSRSKEQDDIRQLIRLGMETKRLLKEVGTPSRFVRPQSGMSLSSVTANKNNLIISGAEFILFGENGLAVTEAIQPFEEFSKIDFGRPARDAKQGMLPPKLARIMLNLSQITETGHIWDPFCGSGTILTEAYRLGIKNIYGSDINPKAISDTEKNLVWMEENYPDIKAEVSIATNDAKKPVAFVSEKSLDAIVSETFLGPPRNGREKRGELNIRLTEITLLVEQSLKNWKPYLKPEASIVLALPAYITDDEILLTEPNLPDGYEWDQPIPRKLAGKTGGQLTARGGILYGRETQLVWREIVRIKYTK